MKKKKLFRVYRDIEAKTKEDAILEMAETVDRVRDLNQCMWAKEVNRNPCIEIDIKEVVRMMKARGIKKNYIIDGIFENWSTTIIDILEDAYELETELVKEFKREKRR